MTPRGTRTMAAAGARPGRGAQTSARFHRESDGRLRRAMAVALIGVAGSTIAVLGLVELKVQQVRLSYRLDALRTSRAETEELNRRLGVEFAALTSLARLDERARRELGMVTPGRDQVRLAREFVEGGAGLGAAAPRTASAPRATGGTVSATNE
ncbi:MAG: cell division protein FtsL [Candidatus Rokubacteria bacterium]|nr:cell division protein FtsL [Candidatus Rokubacteria bacterium]